MMRVRPLALIFVLLVGALFALPVPAQSQASPIVVPIYFDGSNPSSLISNMIIFHTDNPSTTQTATCLGLNGNFSPNSPYLLFERAFRIQFAQSVQVVSVTYTFSYTVPRDATRRFSPHYKLSPTHNVLNSEVYELPGGGTSGTETISYQLPAWGTFAAGEWLQIGMAVDFEKATQGGSVALSGCNVELLVIPSSPISTPTPTPTPTPTELPAIAVTRHSCALLGERALFTQGWTFSGGAAARTGGGADMPTGGLAQTMLQLQRAVKYALDVRFRATLPQQTYFNVTVGAITLPIYVENTARRQTFTLPPGNYRPDSTGAYPLQVTGPNEGSPLIIEYICLSPITESNVLGFEPVTCAACEFVSTGDLLVDFIRVIEWLFCALRRLIECQLTVLLWQVYRFTADTVLILLALGRWLAESAQGAITWMNGNATAVAYYLAGSLDNTISVGVVTVESGAGFFDAVIAIFQSIFGFLTSGVDRLATTLTTFIEALRDIILEFLGVISDALGVLVTLVSSIVYLLQSAASFVLVAAPQLFEGFSAAFNGEIEVADMTTFNQVAQMLSCQGYTVPGSNALTNAFCETNYIFANTIFAGINRVWLFVLAGALGINVLIHALRMLRRAFG